MFVTIHRTLVAAQEQPGYEHVPSTLTGIFEADIIECSAYVAGSQFMLLSRRGMLDQLDCQCTFFPPARKSHCIIACGGGGSSVRRSVLGAAAAALDLVSLELGLAAGF